ncbi:MAG: hypothetical protein CVV22_10545 [Ignavibacteriae bacterium HGW-Ignavibacteriae-1]|jgi:hypothetical protein|nr:MAG: hypothetical protein CVV22_10545 [Ignavibacteriae bacterium HGW-Ignavibacteriae-1]
MKEHEFLKPDEKLTAFIDGELSKEELGTLFYELAQNPDMQEEFNQLMLIKNTFRNKQMAAPDFLKEKILTKVGLATPTLIERIFSPAFYSAIFAGSWLRIASVSSLVLLIGLMIFSKFNDSNSNSEMRQILLTSESSAPQYPIMSSQSEDETVSTNSANNSSTSRRVNSQSGLAASNRNAVVIPVQDDLSDELAQLLNNDNLSAKESNFRAIDNSHPYNANYFDFGGANSYGVVQSPNYTSLGRFLSNVSLSFKKFGAYSFPNFDLAASNEPIMNNFSIGANYKVGKNHSVGFAVGQENFMMQFDQQEGEIIYDYKQSYNSTWYAGTYKYVFAEIGNSGVIPEFNLLMGASNVGPLGKLGGGIGYMISDNFVVNVGLDYSAMFYPSRGDWKNGKWFMTQKLGYSIGIGASL